PEVPFDRAIASSDIFKIRCQIMQSLENPPRFPAMNLNFDVAGTGNQAMRKHYTLRRRTLMKAQRKAVCLCPAAADNRRVEVG
ncbi:hypothetical protein ACVBGC_34915, partial [Burkholderia stagnalis]